MEKKSIFLSKTIIHHHIEPQEMDHMLVTGNAKKVISTLINDIVQQIKHKSQSECIYFGKNKETMEKLKKNKIEFLHQTELSFGLYDKPMHVPIHQWIDLQGIFFEDVYGFKNEDIQLLRRLLRRIERKKEDRQKMTQYKDYIYALDDEFQSRMTFLMQEGLKMSPEEEYAYVTVRETYQDLHEALLEMPPIEKKSLIVDTTPLTRLLSSYLVHFTSLDISSSNLTNKLIVLDEPDIKYSERIMKRLLSEAREKQIYFLFVSPPSSLPPFIREECLIKLQVNHDEHQQHICTLQTKTKKEKFTI